MLLKGDGCEATARVPTWQDLVTWEKERDDVTKGAFVSMRRLWQRIRTSGGEGMRAGTEVAFAMRVLEACGNGVVVREISDEDEYSTELAEAYVKFAGKGPLHALDIGGKMQALVREPKAAELEHYDKASDKAKLDAALALVKSCLLWTQGAPEREPMVPILEKLPVIVTSVAAAIVTFGGMTISVELGES